MAGFLSHKKLALILTGVLTVGCSIDGVKIVTVDSPTTTSTTSVLRGKVEVDDKELSKAPGIVPLAKVGLSGATVELLVNGQVTATTTTATDGSWAITGVTPGTYSVRAWYKTSAGTLSITKDAITVVAGGNSIDIGLLTLQMTGAIDGSVELSDVGDWSDVNVFVPGTSFVARTGTDGKFTLFYVPPGSWELRAAKTGYSSVSVTGVVVDPGKVTHIQDTLVLLKVDSGLDSDGDGVADLIDNCPAVENPLQGDNDYDKIGDICDLDDDNDQFTDAREVECNTDPMNKNSVPLDIDGDGICDYVDSDDDNDGVADVVDAFPFNASESLDTDGDGTGDNADTDDDNDTWSDIDEASCGTNSKDADSVPLDTDFDRICNPVDTDDDNDGYTDSIELSQGTNPIDVGSIPAPPETAILNPLTDTTQLTSATFSFSSTSATFDHFICSLDGQLADFCSSPMTLYNLAHGIHQFVVTSVDIAGYQDPTPATAEWMVDRGGAFEWAVTFGTDTAVTAVSAISVSGTVIVAGRSSNALFFTKGATNPIISVPENKLFFADFSKQGDFQQVITADVTGNNPESISGNFVTSTGSSVMSRMIC